MSEQHKIAGSKGGKSTVEKYGREYMRLLAKKGADATWSKYKLVPVDLGNYAMVDRQTDKIIAVRFR